MLEKYSVPEDLYKKEALNYQKKLDELRKKQEEEEEKETTDEPKEKS